MSKELVKRMQKTSYAILCDIDVFCRKNNIRYFLSGGSVLGAVRHKGFIPWDDDVDIMMPRADYERFIKTFGRFKPDRYKVGSSVLDKTWHRQFSRVWDINTELNSEYIEEQTMGVFVDIFPIDGLPSNAFLRKLLYMRLKGLNVMRNAAQRKKFWDYEKGIYIKKLLRLFALPFGAPYFARRINEVAAKYDFDSSSLVGVSTALHYGERETIPRKCMARPVFLMFEDRKFPVPIGYERYLSNLYGDYMQIPKDAEEKGYSHLDGWTVVFKDEQKPC